MKMLLELFIAVVFIPIGLRGMSKDENMLLNAVKQNCGNYLLDDYLKMTPAQRIQKKREQIKILNKAITASLAGKNIDQQSSLLAALLTDSNVSEYVFSYIVKHRNTIPQELFPIILHWYIHPIIKNNKNSNIVIRNIIINFPDPNLLLPNDAKLLEAQILYNENVNILYILYWPNLSTRAEQKLIKMAAKATDTINKNKWRRNWLAACILSRFGKAYYPEKTLYIAQQLFSKNTRFILIYVPLGLALSSQKSAVEFLVKLLNSPLISSKTPDADPPQIKLAHEAACMLYFMVKNFPRCTPYEKFDASKKEEFQSWWNRNNNNIQLIHHDLYFFLKNTELGVF